MNHCTGYKPADQQPLPTISSNCTAAAPGNKTTNLVDAEYDDSSQDSAEDSDEPVPAIDERPGRRGAKRWKPHTNQQRFNIIRRYDELLAEALEANENIGKRSGWKQRTYAQIAEETGVAVSLISKYVKPTAEGGES